MTETDPVSWSGFGPRLIEGPNVSFLVYQCFRSIPILYSVPISHLLTIDQIAPSRSWTPPPVPGWASYNGEPFHSREADLLFLYSAGRESSE